MKSARFFWNFSSQRFLDGEYSKNVGLLPQDWALASNIAPSAQSWFLEDCSGT